MVTDRNRPVAELGPAPTTGPDLDRLIAAGRVSRPARSGLPGSLERQAAAARLAGRRNAEKCNLDASLSNSLHIDI